MAWGGEQRELSAAARQALAVRHAPMVRLLANQLIREHRASRSLFEPLVGVGTQALAESLRATSVPSGPGFERFARSRIRTAVESALLSFELRA